MPANPTTQRMGELHEEQLAESFGCKKTKSSGNQWADQGDGRGHHQDPFAFCVDGKSTKGRSLTFSLDQITKLREEAQGERPAFGARWYGNDALTVVLEDWALLQLTDVEEMLPASRAWAALQAALGGEVTPAAVLDLVTTVGEATGELDRIRGEVDAARQKVGQAQILLAEVAAERDQYRELATAAQQGRMIPPNVPRLPWTVVHQVRLQNRTETSGISYAADGRLTQVEVREIRVERSPDSRNRPRLIVNGVRVPDGDLYADGLLVARVCDSDPAVIERG